MLSRLLGVLFLTVFCALPAWAQSTKAPVLPLAGDLASGDQALLLQYLSTYKLGPGDVITVVVLGEEDLSREKIRLTDVGSYFAPSLGEVVVLGRTLSEVEKMVVDGLRGRFLVDPKVSVFVEEYRPFFINGMVEKSGGYPWQPGLTVRKAAALAGGFRVRASLKNIFMIRAADASQRSTRVDLNAMVFPGDIVTVEESFF